MARRPLPASDRRRMAAAPARARGECRAASVRGRRAALVVAAAALVVIAGARDLRGSARAAGTLRGRVAIRNLVESPQPRPGISDLGVDPAYEPVDRRRAVVYLETAPLSAFEEGPDVHVTMRQQNETFVPHVLAIRVGTVVDFPNGDPFFHNVFSLSKARRFDLGRYAAGRSKSVRFDEPGIVRVFCDIHSHMSAFILVFAHRFFAVTDDQGRYRIDRVPPGTYTVTAWYEGVVQQSRTITVPDEGGTVDLDFSLR
jgi:plastocyanin